MEHLLALSTSEKTRGVYRSANKLFENFISASNLRDCSFDEQLALFITLLSITDRSPSTISTYVSGVKSQAKLRGVTLDNEFLVMRMLKGTRTFNWGPGYPVSLFWSNICPLSLNTWLRGFQITLGAST